MSDQPVIDPQRFARDGATLSGEVSPARLGRLQDELVDNDGTVRYRVSGFLSERGDPALRLELSGQLGLRCQRCLGRLAFTLEVDRDLVFASSAHEFEQREDEDDGVDVIPLVPRLDLLQLIEDEVLLSMPMAPRHLDGACEGQQAQQRGRSSSASPFAALAKLKQ